LLAHMWPVWKHYKIIITTGALTSPGSSKRGWDEVGWSEWPGNFTGGHVQSSLGHPANASLWFGTLVGIEVVDVRHLVCDLKVTNHRVTLYTRTPNTLASLYFSSAGNLCLCIQSGPEKWTVVLRVIVTASVMDQLKEIPLLESLLNFKKDA